MAKEAPDLAEALRAAALCNDAVLNEKGGVWSIDGDPTEGALLTAALKAGFDRHTETRERPRTDEIPFELQHGFMATLHHDHFGNGFIYVKGAPERLIEMCCWQRDSGGGQHSLAADYWLRSIDGIAAKGYRVLGVAVKQAGAGHGLLEFGDVAHGLTFLGLFGLIDPPREEAIAALTECIAAGIGVKMITGDHAMTAVAIARELGLATPDNVLTGRISTNCRMKNLGPAVLNTNVFARTSPEHKLRLVKSLQSHDHIVSMTGDGVNDAPALKRADIGVAMGVKGTEAAKEAAEIVLADDNYASIVHAVREGRAVYDNLKKTILYILPTNSAMGLIVVAAIAAGEALPVTPVQLLCSIDLVTAVTLGLALGFEAPEPDIMKRPPRPARRADRVQILHVANSLCIGPDAHRDFRILPIGDSATSKHRDRANHRGQHLGHVPDNLSFQRPISIRAVHVLARSLRKPSGADRRRFMRYLPNSLHLCPLDANSFRHDGVGFRHLGSHHRGQCCAFCCHGNRKGGVSICRSA